MNPFFSIVIPTYNRADFIGKTIKSLLDQTHQDFEIIVVDNDSTDNTESLIKEFKDVRISYYKKENERQAVARNYGVNKSKGEYINFFDSDDLAYPNHLESAFNFISTTKDIDVFHQNYDGKDAKGNYVSQPTKVTNINKQIIEGNLLAITGVFMKKAVANNNPFCENQKLIGSEDYFLWLQLCARYKFYSNPVITTTYIYHTSNSTIKFSKDSLIKRKELMINLLKEDKISSIYYKNQFKNLQAHTNLYIALHILLAKEKRAAIKYIINGIKKSPHLMFTKRFAVILLYLIGIK